MDTTETTSAATAAAKQDWYETTESNYTNYERSLSEFINRRITAKGFLQLPVNSHNMRIVRYYADKEGNALGRLKVAHPTTEETQLVFVDETLLDALLAAITSV